MKVTFSAFNLHKSLYSKLIIDNWKIDEGSSWAVFATDQDVGSLLLKVLTDNLKKSDDYTGHVNRTASKVAHVSLIDQQDLLESELAKDDTDFLNRVDIGSNVYELIFQECQNEMLTQSLLKELDLGHLQSHGFRQLSSGETRRIMLARALAMEPDFLVLDNILTGLDIAHRQSISRLLTSLSSRDKNPIQMLVIFSREEDAPEWIENIALFSQGEFKETMVKMSWEQHPLINQIKEQSAVQSQNIVSLIRRHQYQPNSIEPIFEIKHGQVNYLDNIIFTDIHWRIENRQHWQIQGPNGCGKSTLLGLIFGDHPQCYSNDIYIFGKKRGTGETIWDIKKQIGMVSSALHLQYRVSCSALQVVLSGFYDSIGLYTIPTRKEREQAKEWLAILNMSQYETTSFRQLDYSQQRLLLIARALVKQPKLLILDEPYQGLDYFGKRLIQTTVDFIARENLSQLLYVSHYEDDHIESIQNTLVFYYDIGLECYRTKVMKL
ncbi:ATP-binding cassette domain-containing protein [uncultured Shewanella sp.]|uniref:ATP-binding cassette domain-containing protein n=1 Tax=uncultured Shewanella sp. TaxID=173975 RepID=UPI00261A414F|nr:ATP-binding cassette domain-containing protein [uncultured Shewanella sp.]